MVFRIVRAMGGEGGEERLGKLISNESEKRNRMR